jgi:hypothetical protein
MLSLDAVTTVAGWIIRISCVALGGLCIPGPAAAQFSAHPVALRLTSVADTASVAVVRVRNHGTEHMQFRFYLSDFDQTEEGEHRFMEPRQHPSSCTDRLTVIPERAVVAPQASYEVRVRLEHGPTSCWSMLFAETVTGEGGSMSVAQRIGIKIYGLLPFARKDGEITHVQASVSDRIVRTELEFVNSGELPLVVHGRVELRSLDGAVARTQQIDDFAVLPSYRRRLKVGLSVAGLSGSYIAVPVLDFGGEYLAGGQAVVQITGDP